MGTSLEMRQKAIPWKRINIKMANPNKSGTIKAL